MVGEEIQQVHRKWRLAADCLAEHVERERVGHAPDFLVCGRVGQRFVRGLAGCHGLLLAGLAAAVHLLLMAGEQLKANFPFHKDDVNELSNEISFDKNI